MIPDMRRAVFVVAAGRSQLDTSDQALDDQVAMAIAIARRLRPPMKVFANELRLEMGWSSLSRRAVYAWERGEARVPAAALLAAAMVSETSVDELLARARHLKLLGLMPGE
jgi:hypothetical protein